MQMVTYKAHWMDWIEDAMHTPLQICISQGIQRIVDTPQAACKPLIMIQETPNDTDAELEA